MSKLIVTMSSPFNSHPFPFQPAGSISQTTVSCTVKAKRLLPLPRLTPEGAGFLAMGYFLFIVFLSNSLLAKTNMKTLGITVTIGTIGIFAFVLFTLFFL